MAKKSRKAEKSWKNSVRGGGGGGGGAKAGGKERKPNLSCIIIGASTPDAADITHKGSPSKYTSGRKYSNVI